MKGSGRIAMREGMMGNSAGLVALADGPRGLGIALGLYESWQRRRRIGWLRGS
jgi:hypothetical protein